MTSSTTPPRRSPASSPPAGRTSAHPAGGRTARQPKPASDLFKEPINRGPVDEQSSLTSFEETEDNEADAAGSDEDPELLAEYDDAAQPESESGVSPNMASLAINPARLSSAELERWPRPVPRPLPYT